VPAPPLKAADETVEPKLVAATSAETMKSPSGSEAFAQRAPRLVVFPSRLAREFSNFRISQTPFALGSSLAQPQTCR
jgi:hypothetical protein